MNIINYLGCETHLSRQKSSLRFTEGKEVDQAELNLVHCLRVRFSMFSNRLQLYPIFWLPAYNLRSTAMIFSSIWSIFAAVVEQVNSPWLLGCLLVTLMTFYQVRCASEVSPRLPPTIFLWFCPQSPLESSWNGSRTAFIFFSAYSPYPILKVLI